jgi:hypothetical protein
MEATVEGRYPAGIVALWCGQRDRGDAAACLSWLRTGLIERLIRPGLLSQPSWYVRGGGAAGEMEHLVIFETDHPEQAAALRLLRADTGDRLWKPPGMQLRRANVYRRIGPEFRTNGGKRVTGILAVETRCTDPAREEEFNAWYNGMHVHDQLSSGWYHTAYRYRAVQEEGASGPYLALYETDAPDPNEPSEEILRFWRPKWVAEGRWSDLIEITSRAAYATVSEHDSFSGLSAGDERDGGTR